MFLILLLLFSRVFPVLLSLFADVISLDARRFKISAHVSSPGHPPRSNFPYSINWPPGDRNENLACISNWQDMVKANPFSYIRSILSDEIVLSYISSWCLFFKKKGK